MKTVYLCGPINGCSDAECKDWRAVAATALADRYRVLDPMDRDYRGREDQFMGDIVAQDYMDIARCDILLAMADRPSWGTAMEIHHAFRSGKHVLSVVGDGRVSPWLRFHSTRLFASMDEAINFLLED